MPHKQILLIWLVEHPSHVIQYFAMMRTPKFNIGQSPVQYLNISIGAKQRCSKINLCAANLSKRGNGSNNPDFTLWFYFAAMHSYIQYANNVISTTTFCCIINDLGLNKDKITRAEIEPMTSNWTISSPILVIGHIFLYVISLINIFNQSVCLLL